MRCNTLPRHAALILALVLVAGCDTLDTTGSGGAALMSRLDGVWTRTITTERIGPTGTVTPEGAPRSDAYQIATRVDCNQTFVESSGDDNRVAVAYDPANPRGFRACDVITSDGTASRIIFVAAGANIVDDVVGTIDENSGSRQVWAFYAFDGADAIRTVWTLTR